MNDFIVSLMLLGAISSSDGNLPYWMTTNQYGLMPERNGGLALIQANTQFNDSTALQFRWGASLGANYYDNPLVADAPKAHLMVDELYGTLKWKKLEKVTIDLGAKHRENLFLGASSSLGSMSVTGGHLVESGNARPMPGVMVNLAPVAVPLTFKNLWIYGSYGDLMTIDNNYVKGSLAHRSILGLKLTPTDRISFDAILDHYSLWGGTIPEYGKMNVNLANYFRVITGRSASTDGTRNDQTYVIGDQGGSEIFRFTYEADDWTLVAQHDIPYNIGGGMAFKNFPDGVNTIAFSHKDKSRWISDVLYEHQYTMYQSGTSVTPMKGGFFHKLSATNKGGENYFHSGEYKSGWSHFGHAIGNPLFLPGGTHAGTWTSAITNMSFENNRLKAHHFALGGRLWHKHPYKMMVTYSENFGTYLAPYMGESQWDKPWKSIKEEGLKQLSFAFTGTIGKTDVKDGFLNVEGLDFLYGLYGDYGHMYKNAVGVTLGIRYTPPKKH